MDPRKFITQNWISIPAILIGLYTIYIDQKPSYEREPVFRSDPSRVQILDADRISEAPIKVIRAKDNTEITSSLFVIRFSFWNNGSRPIDRQDIRREIYVELDDPEAEIIEYKILKSSDDTNFSLTENPGSPDRSLRIDFITLEKNEGATCQIIYGGDSQADFTIDGRIKETDGILTSTTQSPFPYFPGSAWTIAKWVIMIIGPVYVFMFVKQIVVLRKISKSEISLDLRYIVLIAVAIMLLASMFAGVSIIKPDLYSIPSDILP